jgi:NAD dependent epimerase/dehydratase family enzyme
MVEPSHETLNSSSPSTLLYSTVFTGGQFVAPVKLSKAGFVFADTDLKDTISRILK